MRFGPFGHSQYVAPFTGAWIEINTTIVTASKTYTVAPFTGAWIEITHGTWTILSSSQVAPFTGAWIEINSRKDASQDADGRRTLHGCVD